MPDPINGTPPLPINNALGLPPGMTPKVIPLRIDARASQNVLVDLTEQQQRGIFGPFQTMYVDNSGNSQPVMIITQVLNQQMTVPAGGQAILPLLVSPTAPKFNVITTGAVFVPIAILNIPMDYQVWNADGSSGGTIPVSDAALEALIVNKGQGDGLGVYDLALNPLITNQGAGLGLNVNVIESVGGGSNATTLIVGNFLFSGTLQYDSAAPTGGKHWFVTNISCYIGAGLANSGFSILNMFDTGGTINIWQGLMDDYSVVPNPQGFNCVNQKFDSPIEITNGAAIRTKLTTGGAAISAGFINFNIWGYQK